MRALAAVEFLPAAVASELASAFRMDGAMLASLSSADAAARVGSAQADEEAPYRSEGQTLRLGFVSVMVECVAVLRAQHACGRRG